MLLLLEFAAFAPSLGDMMLLPCCGFLLWFLDRLLAKRRNMRASNFINCRLGLWPESFFSLGQRRWNVLALQASLGVRALLVDDHD